MQLPFAGAAYIHRVRFGFYTVARLLRQRLTDLAIPIESSSQEILTRGRAWEDAGLAAQKGYAERDAVIEELEICTQRIRHQLASRDLGSDKKPPYTLVFPNGIGEYLGVPLEDQSLHFGTLISRLESNLPETDPVRAELVPELKKGLEARDAANKTLDALLQQETLAADQLASTEAAWEKLMRDTHKTLSTRFDEKRADRFFRKPQKRAKKDEGGSKGG